MSLAMPSRHTARLTYALDLKCTVGTGDGFNRRPVFGQAVIAYDHRGRWWIETIMVHSRYYGRPDMELAAGGELWRAIAIELEDAQGEDIAAAINTSLKGCQHLAPFDEHLPRPVRRWSPPLVAAALRRAGAKATRAVRAVATAAALVLMLGSILAIGTLADMPWPGHQLAAHRDHPPFASPADGARR